MAHTGSRVGLYEALRRQVHDRGRRGGHRDQDGDRLHRGRARAAHRRALRRDQGPHAVRRAARRAGQARGAALRWRRDDALGKIGRAGGRRRALERADPATSRAPRSSTWASSRRTTRRRRAILRADLTGGDNVGCHTLTAVTSGILRRARLDARRRHQDAPHEPDAGRRGVPRPDRLPRAHGPRRGPARALQRLPAGVGAHSWPWQLTFCSTEHRAAARRARRREPRASGGVLHVGPRGSCGGAADLAGRSAAGHVGRSRARSASTRLGGCRARRRAPGAARDGRDRLGSLAFPSTDLSALAENGPAAREHAPGSRWLKRSSTGRPSAAGGRARAAAVRLSSKPQFRPRPRRRRASSSSPSVVWIARRPSPPSLA